jgi:hypothetical protein
MDLASPIPKVLGALAIGVAAVAAVVPGAQQSRKPTPCGPVASGHEASAKLTIAGTKMKTTGGRVVMPYGVSVVSGPQAPNWAVTEKAAAAQIVAAHRYWHANAIRLQVSEALVFRNPTRGRGYNVPFAQSVDRLVCRIIKQGDIAVINDTSIFTGRERGPGKRSIRFWRFMSQRYGNRFPVIFDLFNEPQVTRNTRTKKWYDPDTVWRIWRNGGRANGITYVGFQDLVDEIRVKQRVNNVIWAEEPYYTTADQASFGHLPKYLLKGPNIVYAFHKPNMDYDSHSFREVRELVKRKIPLIDSEWGQFAATDRPWMCQSDSYKTAPPYLKFLRDAQIGMLSWSLQPGALVRGVTGTDTVHDGNDIRFTHNPAALSQPTEMRSDYDCSTAAQGQGVGRLVMDYFQRYSQRPPSSLFPKFG